jgi:hypothetical protein
MPEISDFQTHKLRICEIWTKMSHQNHLRTLIFPSGQSLSDSVHYHQCDIFREKNNKLWQTFVESGDRAVVFGRGIKYQIQYIWYTDFLCCVSVIAEAQWRHVYCWPGRRDVFSLNFSQLKFGGSSTVLSEISTLLWRLAYNFFKVFPTDFLLIEE